MANMDNVVLASAATLHVAVCTYAATQAETEWSLSPSGSHPKGTERPVVIAAGITLNCPKTNS
jgi:hypothetical protein